MFYPPFGTKQVEIFLFIKRKSAILIHCILGSCKIFVI